MINLSASIRMESSSSITARVQRGDKAGCGLKKLPFTGRNKITLQLHRLLQVSFLLHYSSSSSLLYTLCPGAYLTREPLALSGIFPNLSNGYRMYSTFDRTRPNGTYIAQEKRFSVLRVSRVVAKLWPQTVRRWLPEVCLTGPKLLLSLLWNISSPSIQQ